MKKHNSFINAKTRKVQVNLRITKDQHKKLIEISRKRGISQNALLRASLDHYFAQSERI